MHACTRLLTISLLITSLSCSGWEQRKINIGYIYSSDEPSLEDNNVCDWLEANNHFNLKRIKTRAEYSMIEDCDVIWLHLPQSSDYYKWSQNPMNRERLRKIIEKGKSLLLTDYAFLTLHDLGIEKIRPQIKKIKIQDDWLFDEKGFQGWLGHPIFKGLFGGAFIFDAVEDQDVVLIGYFGKNFPAAGKIVGVEKSYITIHRQNRLIVEYRKNKSTIIAIGGLIHFSYKNRLKYNLKKLIENSILYLSGTLKTPAPTYWEKHDYSPKKIELKTKSFRLPDKRRLNYRVSTGLLYSIDNPDNSFYDLAGERVLIMGKENEGIDEIWVHPFRLLRSYEAGIVINGSIKWFREFPVKIDIRPESITRLYETDLGKIRETIYPSMKRPAGLIHYESSSNQSMQIAVRLLSDIRLMWPYDEYALGDIYYGYDNTLGALHVRDRSGKFASIFGGDLTPIDHIEGPFINIKLISGKLNGHTSDLNRICFAAIYELNRENDFCLNFTVCGTNMGTRKAFSHYTHMVENPQIEYENTVDHYRKMLERLLIIDTPDEEFNRLWKWALVGADRFYVSTPEIGQGLLAGYSTTDRGWNGGHKISGRPGYGWYFGRDGAWSCFALDDCGSLETVKSQLKLFQKFQDRSGKIFHELSTSGVVHYDAADATPLYIILAAHYLKASGDLKFIRESWANIRKAIDFLYSTDTDGDGLIENTNVGHGWVEGGKLWGAHTTFYLAGLWAQALKDAAFICRNLNKIELSEQFLKDSEKVREALNTEFWNEKDKFFYYGKMRDGSFNPEKSVLPAVPALFGLLEDEKINYLLKEYSSNRFSSDWGVRIISSRSPLFNPRGYHYGSVWPLFTGWTALAEYEYGNTVQGFTHILNNLYIKNSWAKGLVEEVLDGSIYRPSGVCPHQCWSETNIIQPSIEGMIGWEPNATKRRGTLKPRFPLNWDSVGVKNLRIGKSLIDFKFTRSMNQTTYELELKKGIPVVIMIHPEVLDGMRIDEILLDSKPIKFTGKTRHHLLINPVRINLNKKSKLVLKHHGGIGMIPKILRPAPGERSSGCKIIRSGLKNNVYYIDLEAKQGSREPFSLRIFDVKPIRIEGAELVSMNKNGTVEFVVSFPKSKKEFVGKTVRIIF